MSYCEHDVHCPGYGPAHDAGLKVPTPTEAVATEWQRGQANTDDSDLVALREMRGDLKPELRSGNPVKRAKAQATSRAIEAHVREILARQQENS